jgi:hypothetical protein
MAGLPKQQDYAYVLRIADVIQTDVLVADW